ncbi:MAG TPA: hypothetical protein VG454_01055 [Gemmatimonadales bacterium]|nr:hypothetical protein [Gemmatimonadales bacterium]
MARRTPTLLLLVIALTRPARAQWDLGIQLSTTHYRGSAHDTTSSGVENVRPGDAMMIGLRLDHPIGRVRFAVQAAYGKPGLSATGPGLTVTDKTSGQLFEGGALVNFRVVGIGSSGAIRAELGPALHLWKSDDEVRTRVGGMGAAVYEWPVAERFTGTIRFEGMISKSWFDAVDLPPELERQVTWRYGVSLGLRYRL